jgi:gas vesicle structural protein
MTVATQRQGGGGAYVDRGGGNSSSLADVVELILDRGLVIDVFVRVSLVGIEILTVDARIVVASVDTYLRFAEAVNRLDISSESESVGLPELADSLTSGGAKSKTQGALEGVKEKLLGDEEEEEEKEKEPRRSRSRSRSSSSGSSRRSSSSRSSSGSGSRGKKASS